VAKTVLPTLATGALSGVGSALAQKVTKKAMGNGLYLKKGSNIARVETDGQGLYLKPYKGSGLGMVGNGLYLKQRERESFFTQTLNNFIQIKAKALGHRKKTVEQVVSLGTSPQFHKFLSWFKVDGRIIANLIRFLF